MHVQEFWEEMGVVAPEVREELRVFVEPQELADDLDSEDLGIAERRGGSAPSEGPEVLESVIYEAEDGYDEGAKIHKKTSATSLWCYWSTPSVGRSCVLLKSSMKLAHGVS